MSDCLKCFYPRGEPKGNRLCKKCRRVEGTPKGQFQPTEAASAASSSGPDTSVQPALNTGPVSATQELPAHSKMGGSAAHRFLNCTGSTALLAQLKIDGVRDDPDWTRDGTQAHELAARALDTDVDAWELVHAYPELNALNATQAVQVYLDYVRSRPGRRRVEVKIHLPELSPYMFSTLDAELVPVSGADDLVLEIVDYKHGEGIYVEVEENDQLKYYACMAVMEDPTFYPDGGRVRLTIAQPRITWADNQVRSWDTTVGALKAWLYDVLLPAMRLEAKDMHLQMGEWCRFCPAKLVCPPHRQAFDAFAGATTELTELSDEVLGRDYLLSATVRMRIKAIENEVIRRRMGGVDIPGTKIVRSKSSREWKEGAEHASVERFGPAAYTVPQVLSPAQMETLPDGKAFVAEWCYTVDNGYTVAPLDDRRKEVALPTPEEKFGPASKYVDLQGIV